MKIKANQTSDYKNIIEDRTTFFYYAFRNILLVGLPLLIISGFVLSHLSFHSSATDGSSGTDNLTISIYSACTLSSVVNNEHNTVVDVGTYKDNIGKTTIKTLCNDGNGYAIYTNGYSNNEEGNNKLINTEYPQYSIDTGLATSGLTSTWAMKLNNIPDDPSPTPPTIETPYNDTYGLIPSYWTKVASRASGTTDMAQGSSFTTTYAVYASSSQYAGTYQGQVKYILLHPNINKPTLSNLELAFVNQGIQPAYQDETGSYFAMQDMTTSICSSVSGDGETTATRLVDTRDNRLYYVAKLADGHCWMTQNLDFNINSNTILNSTTTDLNAIYNSSTGQYAEYDTGYTESNNIIYWTPASTAITIGFQNTGPVTGWINSNTEPYSASKTDSTETGHASLGNYYNWTAAIASNNSSSLTQNTLSDISKNPKNSICPKGWRLPTISSQSAGDTGSTNEYARLNSLYNNNSTTSGVAWSNSPLFFTLTGNINNGNNGSLYSRGFYHSSTYGGYDVYNFTFNDTDVQPQYYFSKGYGRSVRCLAR